VSGTKIYAEYDQCGGLAGEITGGSISGCSVGGNTEIEAKQYVGGIIGRAVTSVNYTVSDCRVDNTVNMWWDPNWRGNPERDIRVGQFIGNPGDHGSITWITGSTSEVIINTYPK